MKEEKEGIPTKRWHPHQTLTPNFGERFLGGIFTNL
jgi:hypothetical protein